MSSHYYRARLYFIEPVITGLFNAATSEQQRAFNEACGERWAGSEDESRYVIEKCLPLLQRRVEQ